ncbi:jerky protein-like [Palaemon carinicauda]|uniref:jerky protein-like n=1 Tax=Palaemon carinicauda TaxID=392227 RepID=UPI0035B62627
MAEAAMEIVSEHGNVPLISDDAVTVVTVGEPPTKKKRVRVDMKTKLEIVEKFEGGQKTSALSEEYGISQRRIYDFCAVVKKLRTLQKDSENDDSEVVSKTLEEPRIRPNWRPWVDSFVVHTSDHEGYVTSHEMLLRLIQEFELDTHSGYVVKKTRRSYGKELGGVLLCFLFTV